MLGIEIMRQFVFARRSAFDRGRCHWPALSRAQVPQSTAQVQLTFAPVVKRVAPAVVNVYARSVVQTPMNPLFTDPFFQRFFGASPECASACSSRWAPASSCAPTASILTNNHVMEGGQDIVVALSDRREFKAKVLLADSRTDLAVLKIDTKGEQLPTVDFGDSDQLAGGRSGARHRRSVRRRPDRDDGHRLGTGAHAESAPATISSSSRRTPPSIPAIRAARW